MATSEDFTLWLSVNQALDYAQEVHDGQFRKSTIMQVPYFNHCWEVVKILSEVTNIEAVLQAAALHDVVEDTAVTVEDIYNNFGSAVASMVDEVTTDAPGMTVKQKKALLREKTPKLSWGAACIKIADGISNVKSIVTLQPPWSLYSQRGYTESTTEVVNMLREREDPLRPPKPLFDLFDMTSQLVLEAISFKEEAARQAKAAKKAMG